MSGWIPGYYWMHFLDLFACPHLFRMQIHQKCIPCSSLLAYSTVRPYSMKYQVPSPQSHMSIGSYHSELVGPFWRYFPNEIGNIWNSFLSHILFLALFTYFTSCRNFNELVCEKWNAGWPRFVNIPGCHSCKTPGGVLPGSHICSDRS